MFLRKLCLFVALLLSFSAFATPSRQLAEVAAALLEDTFVDAKRATEMATEIRKRAAAGAYDSLSGADLARALTQTIHAVEHDKHVSVAYKAESASQPVPSVAEARARLAEMRRGAGGRPGGGGGPAGDSAAGRRNNFGVRAVEHLAGNVGYLRIDTFHDLSTSRDTITAAMKFLDNADAVIVDLRHNNGGANSAVVYLASYFMPKDHGELITSRWRSSPEPAVSRVMETPTRRFENVPLYILTSKRTFSAGEAFAYILQQFGRATVVGETTAGGGRPNAFLQLGGGYTLSVSIGAVEHPRTKTGWQGVGVVPNSAAAEAQALEVAANAARAQLAAKEGKPAPSTVPPQVEALIAAMNGPAADFETFAREHYAASLLDMRTPAERARFIERLRGDFGRVSVAKVAEASPRRTVLEISGTTGTQARMVIEHDAQKITMVQVELNRGA